MSTGDRAIRTATTVAVVALGGIAAYSSYRHIRDVAVAHGESGATAALLPVCVDGMLLVSSLALLDAARRGQRPPGLGKAALGLGVAATVVANVLHGLPHGPIGAVVSAWPAITLVTVVELTMGMIRRGRDRSEPAFSSAPVGAALNGATERHLGPVATALAAPETRHGEAEIGHAPAGLPAPETHAAVTDSAAAETDHGVSDPVLATARETFAETLSAGAVPSLRRIRRELKVGAPKAARVRDALDAEMDQREP